MPGAQITNWALLFRRRRAAHTELDTGRPGAVAAVTADPRALIDHRLARRG
ncbi:hypothetical protein [Streptomyces olivaceoviridis]|uniref:Uncharacterized protein n=1 Tax=Streptomyces canarius TaxID=285453 RepID=A0ABQ3DC06_9ACTN|nr:hypothetical protein GCM10010345_79890 [Streptomyces canarius]